MINMFMQRIWVPSPLAGEGQGEGAFGRAVIVNTPHPGLPPQGGKEEERPDPTPESRHISLSCNLWWYVILVVLLVSCGLLIGGTVAAEQARPIRIGALNTSWGPVPSEVGLRDGLRELGYRENEDFVIGTRFTQGDLTALPAAARDLVHYGVDIIFASFDESAAKAA